MKISIENEKNNKYIVLNRSRSLGSAAMSLCYLAMGAVDICSFERLKCWDVAAGILIIQEARGIVLDSKGKYSSKNIIKYIMLSIWYDSLYIKYFFLGNQYKDIMNANILAACTKKLAENFFKLKNVNI